MMANQSNKSTTVLPLWDGKINKIIQEAKENVLLIYKDAMNKAFKENDDFLEPEKLQSLSSKIIEKCSIALLEKLWQPLNSEDLNKEDVWLRLELEKERARYFSMNEVRKIRDEQKLDELVTKCLNRYFQEISERWEETPFMDETILQQCNETCKKIAIQIFNKENKVGSKDLIKIYSSKLDNEIKKVFEHYTTQMTEADNFVKTSMNEVVAFCYSNEEINREMNNAWNEDTHFQLFSFLQKTVEALMARKTKYEIISFANGLNFCLEIQKKILIIYELFFRKFGDSKSDRDKRNVKAVDEAYDFYEQELLKLYNRPKFFHTNNLQAKHGDLKESAIELFIKTSHCIPNISVCLEPFKKKLEERIESKFKRISNMNEENKKAFVKESKRQAIQSFKTLMNKKASLDEFTIFDSSAKLKYIAQFKAKYEDKLDEQDLKENLSSLEIQLDEERGRIFAESQNKITKALEKLVESSVNEYDKLMNIQLDISPFMDYENLLKIDNVFKINSTERFNKSVGEVTKGKESSRDLINLFTKKLKEGLTAAFQKWETKYFLKVKETDKIADTFLDKIVAFYDRKIRTNIENLLNESDLESKHNRLVDSSFDVFKANNPYLKNQSISELYLSKLREKLLTAYEIVLKEFSQSKKAKVPEEIQVVKNMIIQDVEMEVCSEMNLINITANPYEESQVDSKSSKKARVFYLEHFKLPGKQIIKNKSQIKPKIAPQVTQDISKLKQLQNKIQSRFDKCFESNSTMTKAALAAKQDCLQNYREEMMKHWNSVCDMAEVKVLHEITLKESIDRFLIKYGFKKNKETTSSPQIVEDLKLEMECLFIQEFKEEFFLKRKFPKGSSLEAKEEKDDTENEIPIKSNEEKLNPQTSETESVEQDICANHRIDTLLKVFSTCPSLSSPSKTLFVAFGKPAFVDKNIWGIPPPVDSISSEAHPEEWLSRGIHPSKDSESNNKFSCIICKDEDQDMREFKDIILHMNGLAHREALALGFSEEGLKGLRLEILFPKVFRYF